jgi:hypothetical protein
LCLRVPKDWFTCVHRVVAVTFVFSDKVILHNLITAVEILESLVSAIYVHGRRFYWLIFTVYHWFACMYNYSYHLNLNWHFNNSYPGCVVMVACKCSNSWLTDCDVICFQACLTVSLSYSLSIWLFCLLHHSRLMTLTNKFPE